MKQFYLIRFSLTLLITFLVTSLFSQVIYVKKDAAGTNNGTSWVNAYTKLENALAVATAGQIWVASGTYKPGGTTPDSSSVFAIKSTVALYGGFAGTETMLGQRNPVTNVTTLSGDINGDDAAGVFATGKSDNTLHVVYVDSLLTGTITIDGFSVVGGNTKDDGTLNQYLWRGGGIYSRSKIKVNACKFSNNFGRGGAAIYITTGTNGSEVTNSSFTQNYSTSQSAGILANGVSNILVKKCTFNQNQTTRGAFYTLASTNVTVDSCLFELNTNTLSAGGAFYNVNSANVMLSNSNFIGNAALSAGALHYDGDLSSIIDPNNFIIFNCLFRQNSATAGAGGAMRDVRGSYTAENCIFDGNTSTASGGHIRNDVVGDNVVYKNCTFKKSSSGGWGGAHASYGAGSNFVIENCTYEENTTTNLGGAVNHGFGSKSTYTDCTFTSNTSVNSSGGALAMQNDSTSIIVLNSTFTSNKCLNSGGAIYGVTGGAGFIVVDKCDFETNEITGTTGTGGAIYAGESASPTGILDIGTLTLSNSTFTFNTSPVQGGGLNLSNVDATVYSCLFNNNIANGVGTGGAISNNSSDSSHVEVLIMNSTFADNTGALAGGIAEWTGLLEASSNTTVQNCIFAQDGLINYAIEDGTPALISNGGNLSDDATMETYLTHAKDINGESPAFVDPNDFNYRLQDGSTGIDAGVNAGAPMLDLDGNPRINKVDMGAYENQNVTNAHETLVANNGTLTLSPNPVMAPSVTAKIDNNWTGTLQVRLVNVLGQSVHTMEIEKAGQVMKFEIPLAIKTGVYNLLVSNGEQVVVEKLIRL